MSQTFPNSSPQHPQHPPRPPGSYLSFMTGGTFRGHPNYEDRFAFSDGTYISDRRRMQTAGRRQSSPGPSDPVETYSNDLYEDLITGFPTEGDDPSKWRWIPLINNPHSGSRPIDMPRNPKEINEFLDRPTSYRRELPRVEQPTHEEPPENPFGTLLRRRIRMSENDPHAMEVLTRVVRRSLLSQQGDVQTVMREGLAGDSRSEDLVREALRRRRSDAPELSDEQIETETRMPSPVLRISPTPQPMDHADRLESPPRQSTPRSSPMLSPLGEQFNTTIDVPSSESARFSSPAPNDDVDESDPAHGFDTSDLVSELNSISGTPPDTRDNMTEGNITEHSTAEVSINENPADQAPTETSQTSGVLGKHAADDDLTMEDAAETGAAVNAGAEERAHHELNEPGPCITDDPDGHWWNIESLLDRRVISAREPGRNKRIWVVQYLVKYAGWDDSHNHWRDEKDISQDVVDEYDAEHPWGRGQLTRVVRQ